jgi:hypothetical protein
MTSNSSTENLQSQSQMNTPPFVRLKTHDTNKNIVIFA